MKRKIIPYNPSLKNLAKQLRKQMTFSEVKLWMLLNNFQMMGYDFDRQRPILNYIVDFYCKDLQLVIEVDGITHMDTNAVEKDEIRDDELNEYGITVLRFNALDVLHNSCACLENIEAWIIGYEKVNGVEAHLLKRRKPTPPLASLQGGEDEKKNEHNKL
ncbi:MAG: endonuclease domain-containing protein [Chitinophagaceae bacterium]|jgi:very-short-patch-repair endonuclease|nr:endonuclease domain-containing protein [Chitinophagaceae bacterium]